MRKKSADEVKLPEGCSALIANPAGEVMVCFPKTEADDEADEGMNLIGALALAIHDEAFMDQAYKLLAEDVAETVH